MSLTSRILLVQPRDELVREAARLAVSVEHARLDLQDLHKPSNGSVEAIETIDPLD
jgi:hypothetical protein